MICLDHLEVWFVTGSQHLYGQKTLDEVAEHARTIARSLSESRQIPLKVVFKSVLTTPEAVSALCQGCERRKELHRADHLDAHLLSREDVDRRAETTA